MSHDTEIVIKKGNEKTVIMASSLRVWKDRGWEKADDDEAKPKRNARKKTTAKKTAEKKAASE